MSASAQTMLRDYAGLRWPSLNHKGRISRLSQVLGLGHRRVRSIYQNEETARLRADEMERIQALAEEANKNEFQALQDRVARLEAALTSVDEEFYQPFMAGVRQAAYGRRRDDVASAAASATDGDGKLEGETEQ